MLSLDISEEARRDLAGVWTYTLEQWSATQADSYYRGLRDAMTLLRENPASGAPVLIRPSPGS